MASLITRLRGSSIAAPLYRRAFFLNFSSDVTDKFKNKEAAEERMYFNKEDEKLLRGLLSKMKAQAECSDRTHIDKERSALLEIVGRYQVNNKDIERLLEWRHRSDF